MTYASQLSICTLGISRSVDKNNLHVYNTQLFSQILTEDWPQSFSAERSLHLSLSLVTCSIDDIILLYLFLCCLFLFLSLSSFFFWMSAYLLFHVFLEFWSCDSHSYLSNCFHCSLFICSHLMSKLYQLLCLSFFQHSPYT